MADKEKVVVQGEPLDNAEDAVQTRDDKKVGNQDIDQWGGRVGVEGDPNRGAPVVDPDATNDPPELYSEAFGGGPDRYGPGPHEDKDPVEVTGVEPSTTREKQ